MQRHADQHVDEYNFGTLLRLKASSDYSEENSMFGKFVRVHKQRRTDSIAATRIQFFAIEIARNQAGLNDWLYEVSTF